MNDVPAETAPRELGKFVHGSTMRHVMVMTGAASVGLVSLFLVDVLSLLYVSWLGRAAWTAGVGFATVVLFFCISTNIGLLIAVSALVSRAIGEGDAGRARRLAASTVVLTGLVAGFISFAILPVLDPLLTLLGAAGEAHAVARRFLRIALPWNPIMGVGMALSAVMRAVGDAKRSMYVTLSGAIVTAIADPILIFGLGLGVTGAAISTVLSRLAILYVGFYYAVRVSRLVAKPRWRHVVADARPMFAIAIPAALANIATPSAQAFLIGIVARFGDAALAAAAIIDRLIPLAFCGIFALSGAVGPILGQNWGAGRFDRLRLALRDSLVFTCMYVGVVWSILLLGRNVMPAIFNVSGTVTGDLIVFYCTISGPVWLFLGFLFVANTAFNNLGFPLLSTAFNWGRATLGTVPVALVGASLGGVEGMMVGIGGGALLFGLAGVFTAFWVVARLARRAGAN